MDEKKHESGAGSLNNASGDESPVRLEEGKDEVFWLDEDETIARVKAFPNESNPIFLTWKRDDPSNPRQWPKWKRWYTLSDINGKCIS